ncbi:Tyrosinase-like protein 3 [Elsinoe fawcettii]|nr:Tyrosinase-like protein 3 [Elsinoe fawcettii]
MHISTLLLLPITFGLSASIPRSTNNTCASPVKRKEWRTLTSSEQQNYLSSVLCLKTKPSRIGLSSPLYDDFPYAHNALNNEIHFVASFLPWHRYFVHVYESALRECGYTGQAVYWDWTLDSPNPQAAPVFDASAFGGNGSPKKTVTLSSGSVRPCVADGTFSNITNAYFGTDYEDHCLIRNFNNGTSEPGDMFAPNYSKEAVDKIQALSGYDAYRRQLEGTPHGAIHSALGGDMIPSTSPNDPLFFLHHTQIDRLWYLWQQVDPQVRETEYSGYRTQEQFDGTTPELAEKSDVMRMWGLAEEVKVEDFLSTTNERVCYEY